MKPFRDFGALTGHGRSDLRADALAIAAEALAAVDPVMALRDLVRLEGDRLVVHGRPWVGLRPPDGDEGDASAIAETRAASETQAVAETAVPLAGRRVVVLGAGKATIGMAALLDDLLGERIAAGCVVVKHGQGRKLRHIEVIEAAHPVPDEGSLAGGRRLLELARGTRPDDLVIGLVTGGSSALAVCPADGVTMPDKVATNRLLLASGADIVAINNVRKHLSRIKGGLLAQACGCEIVNFTVSDVVGDPLDCLTDLLVPDRSTWRDAQATCDRFDLWERLPAAVADRLQAADPADETPKDLRDISTWVVADSARMCTAAAEAAARRGYAARVTGLDLEGEAAAAGRWLAAELHTSPPGTALIAGGENTVALDTTSSGAPAAAARQGGAPDASVGQGGPSQEAAASAALALAGGDRACVLCLDSDGTDGPTDAAGGLVDDLSAAHAARSGVDLAAALGTHGCYQALSATGDLVVTGATGTNVNDLKIALRPR